MENGRFIAVVGARDREISRLFFCFERRKDPKRLEMSRTYRKKPVSWGSPRELQPKRAQNATQREIEEELDDFQYERNAETVRSRESKAQTETGG